MKRIIPLLTAIVLAVTMTIPAFAGNGDYVLGTSSGGAGFTPVNSQYLGTVYPGSSFSWQLMKEGPADAGGNPTYTPVKGPEVRSEKLETTLEADKGKKFIDKVEIRYDANDNALVAITFISPFVSVKTEDLQFTVRIKQNRSNSSTAAIEFTGEFENRSQEVDSDAEYVYLGSAPVAEVNASVRRMEVELDNGVFIYARMNQNKKYYAFCAQDVRAEDTDIVGDYPDIESVLYLETIGFDSSSTVKIERGEKLFVYGEDLEYLGVTGEELAWSNKYYLSASELDGSGSGGGDDDADEPPVDLGGDGEGGGNGSGIPDTGLPGFLSVAIVAGVISLVTMGWIGIKHR